MAVVEKTLFAKDHLTHLAPLGTLSLNKERENTIITA